MYAGNVLLQLKLNRRMQIDKVLRPQKRHHRGSKVRATGKKRVEGTEELIPRIAIAALYVRA